MKQDQKRQSSYCCSNQPVRDKRFGEVVDDFWLTRWLKVHSFYQIFLTICRVLTIKDVYNQSKQLHPETVYQQFEWWKKRRPHWTVGQVCFRIILFELLCSWFLVFIGSGLSMGCTQTLSNITTFITNRNATSTNQRDAYLQGLYFIILFITQIYVNQHASRKSTRAGIKVEQILVLKIYDKLTVISNTYKKHLNKGEILTLFRIQTRHLFTCIQTSHVLVSAPTSITLSSIFIYVKIGYIGLVMLPVIIGALLIQMVISLRMTKLNIRKQEYYQERLAMNMNFYDQLDDIKSLGWEKVVIDRNKIMRAQQNRLHKLFYFYLNIYTSILLIAPSVTMLIYIVLKLSQGSISMLSARNAFTMYNYINQTNTPMANFPTTIRNCMNAYSAMQRLNNFFEAEDIQNHVDNNLIVGDVIIDNYVASLESRASLRQLWRRSELTPFVSRSLYYLLHNQVRKQYTEAEILNPSFQYYDLLFRDVTIPFKIEWKKGQRVVLLTSDPSLSNYILKCFIGDLKTQKGYLKFKGKLGYIKSEQLLFLRDSIKKNILLQQKQDKNRYHAIIQALQLKKIFQRLEKGDETKVDDSYLIFSLSLRKKIALARALYNNSDILLLDWFFESMSPDQANKQYNDYSNHPLIFKNKTVILSCKQIFYLKPEDKVLIMKHGKVQEYGVFQDLLKNHHSHIHDFTSRYLKKIATDYLLPKQHRIMKYMNAVFPINDQEQITPSQTKQQNKQQEPQSDRNLVYNNPKPYQPPELGSYMEWSHYNKLLITGGLSLYFLLFFLNIAGGAVRMYSDWWIGIYSLSYQATNDAAGFIGKYCGMVVGVAIILFVAGLIHPLISQNNTEELLDEVTEAITYCDNEALSKINKMAYAYVFSKDIEDIFKLNFLVECILRNFVLYFGTIVFMGIVSWIIFIIGVVLFVVNIIVMYYYRKAQMELYNISIPLRSQYSLVLETVINGMNTIRTLNKTSQYRKIIMDKFYVTGPVIRMNARYTAHGLTLFGAWVALFTTISIAFIGISMKFGLSPTQVTFVSAAISMSNRLSRRYMILIARDFATFSSTANISIKVLFDKLLKVFPIIRPSVELSQFLITDNSITIQNLYKKSPSNKTPTLKNVNLFIPSNSRVALYGNISKDIETLFKLISRVILPFQPSEYKTVIKIGDTNINSVSSKQLSKTIYILSHDPFFFTGTIRENMDPLNEYYDQQILSALEQVAFWMDLARSKHFSSRQNFGRLDFYIYEMGTELPSSSVHKLNLARAILRKPKIVFYLSAFRTASLLMRQFLRNVMYKNFSNKATILMATFDVAETLRCDYLIGFRKGAVIQQGRPKELVQDTKNRIAQIVEVISQNESEYMLRNRMKVYEMFAEAIEELIRKTRSQG